jgi:tight adherence protein B
MPQTLVKAAISRWECRVEQALPPLIDGVRRGLDSGLDLSASFALATENMPAEAARTFAPAARSLLLGRTMAESMDALRAYTPLPGLQVFAAALSIGADSGGRLNDSLGALANALRDDILARYRLAIAASEATSTSHILLALPAGVTLGMAFFAPASFALLTGTPTGQVALTLSVLWVVIGVLVLRRIVSAALNAASR